MLCRLFSPDIEDSLMNGSLVTAGNAMRSSGSGPGASGSGRGVVTWESRSGALCLGELSPSPSGGYEGGFGFGGGGAGGAATLAASRSLALLPQERLLQVREAVQSHVTHSLPFDWEKKCSS